MPLRPSRIPHRSGRRESDKENPGDMVRPAAIFTYNADEISSLNTAQSQSKKLAKVVHVNAVKAYGIELWFHSFLTSAL